MATPFSVFYFPLLGTPTAEGNELTFYEAGLDVPLDVFTDSDGLVPWAQPIVLNAAGEADGVIYVDPDGPALKVVYVDANGVAVPGYPVDNIPPGEILNVTTVSTTVLTNAQIKALPTTGITLVAAPASGLRVKPFAATLALDSSAGAYTNVNTTSASLVIQTPTGQWLLAPVINDNTTVPALARLTNFLTTTTPLAIDLGIYAESAVTTAKGWVIPFNAGIISTDFDAQLVQIIADNNGSGNFTGGNAANTLTVTLYFCIESLP